MRKNSSISLWCFSVMSVFANAQLIACTEVVPAETADGSELKNDASGGASEVGPSSTRDAGADLDAERRDSGDLDGGQGGDSGGNLDSGQGSDSGGNPDGGNDADASIDAASDGGLPPGLFDVTGTCETSSRTVAVASDPTCSNVAFTVTTSPFKVKVEVRDPEQSANQVSSVNPTAPLSFFPEVMVGPTEWGVVSSNLLKMGTSLKSNQKGISSQYSFVLVGTNSATLAELRIRYASKKLSVEEDGSFSQDVPPTARCTLKRWKCRAELLIP